MSLRAVHWPDRRHGLNGLRRRQTEKTAEAGGGRRQLRLYRPCAHIDATGENRPIQEAYRFSCHYESGKPEAAAARPGCLLAIFQL